MNTRIVLTDTTLRDGEQSPDIAFSAETRLQIADLLVDAGFPIIEAGIPAMGSDEKDMIIRICERKENRKISVWNRMNRTDIAHSFDCAPDIIHISAPASDLMLANLLHKDRNWLSAELRDCVGFAKEKGYEVSVGFQDASRADPRFLLVLSELLSGLEVSSVRLADTVGIFTPDMIRNYFTFLTQNCEMRFGIHTHNDLGLAVANAAAAAKYGAVYLDTTLFGIGERAGNCDSYRLSEAIGESFGMHPLRNQLLQTKEKAMALVFAENDRNDWLTE